MYPLNVLSGTKVKNEWSCTSTPICHDVDMDVFTLPITQTRTTPYKQESIYMCPWPIRHTVLPPACRNSCNCTNTVRTGGEQTRTSTGHIPSTHCRVTTTLTCLFLNCNLAATHLSQFPLRHEPAQNGVQRANFPPASILQVTSTRHTVYVGHSRWLYYRQNLQKVSSLCPRRQLCNKVSSWSTYLPKNSTSKSRRSHPVAW